MSPAALTSRRTSRRVARRGFLAGGLSLLAAGCTAPTAPAPPVGDGFPRTVAHALGSVTIPRRPERVVVLTDRDADTLLSLGVVPVGIHSRYGFDRGVGPWAEAALGDARPEVWTGTGGFAYEAMAALAPDLIVYATSGGERDVHDTLSGIAPTIGLPVGAVPYGAGTAQTTRLVAEALGRDAEGDRVIGAFDGDLARRAAEHPVFAGRTANYLDLYSGGISSYPREHVVNAALHRIGFSPVPAAAGIAAEGSVTVSAERLADFDADVVVAYPFGRTFAELVAETPTLATLPSVRAGRFLVLEDLALPTASVLSVPYALDRLLPRIDAALRTS